MDNTIPFQRIRYGDQVIDIQTTNIDDVECLCLDDVQRRFPSVTSFSCDQIQIAFLRDVQGNCLHPLRIKRIKDKILDAIEPMSTAETLSESALRRLEQKADLILANTQETLMRTKQIMTQMYELHEFTTPRYFFILPVRQKSFSPIQTIENWFHIQYKLYFLCECSTDPDKLHIAPHDGYFINRPSEFIAHYGSYLQMTLSIARNILSVGGFILPSSMVQNSAFNNNTWSPMVEDPSLFVDVDRKLEVVKTAIEQNKNDLVQIDSNSFGSNGIQKVSLNGSQLRELDAFLEQIDSSKSLGNLYRTITDDGHVRWLCAKHANSSDYNNKVLEYIRQCESMGGKYDRVHRQLTLSGSLTAKNIDTLCEALTNGFNVLTIVLKTCSWFNLDFDRFISKIVNQSSVQFIIAKSTEIYKWGGFSRYVCDRLIVEIQNQSMKVLFSRAENGQGSRLVMRLLNENKICSSLEFYGPDLCSSDARFLKYLRDHRSIRNLTINQPIESDFLCGILRNQNSIRRLKLRFCITESSHILDLCHALRNNDTLNEIDLLDHRPIRNLHALSELFRTVQKHINLRSVNIHVDRIEPSNDNENLLTATLSYDSFIKQLRISDSTISKDFAQVLVQASQQKDSLNFLELYHCKVNDETRCILESAYENGNFHHFSISEKSYWSCVQIEAKKKFEFEQVLYKNDDLERKIATSDQHASIFLDDMKLFDLDIKTIVEEAIKKKQCLLLSLQSTKLTLQSIAYLAENLEHNQILETLYLGDCQISDDALYFLAQALTKETSSLKTLVLQNNKITDAGVTYIVQILQTNKKLSWLYLGENQITDEGVHQIMTTLSDDKCALEMLVLSSNRLITDLSVNYIVNMIQLNKNFKKLWIEDCSLSETAKNRLQSLETTTNNVYFRF